MNGRTVGTSELFVISWVSTVSVNQQNICIYGCSNFNPFDKSLPLPLDFTEVREAADEH